MEQEESAPSDKDTSNTAAVEIPFKELLLRMGRLQQKDNDMAKLAAAIEEVPAKVAAQQALIDGLKHEMEDSKAKGRQYLVEKKSVETELAAVEGQIKKHAGELGAIKTNEAYKALLSEIDTLKVKQDAMESRILEIFDLIEVCKKTETTAAATFEQKKKVVEQQIRLCDEEKKHLEA